MHKGNDMKRGIRFQRATSDSIFSLLSVAQESADKLMQLNLDQLPWLTEKGKKGFIDVSKGCQQATLNLKNMVDNGFDIIEKQVAETKKPTPATKPAAKQKETKAATTTAAKKAPAKKKVSPAAKPKPVKKAPATRTTKSTPKTAAAAKQTKPKPTVKAAPAKRSPAKVTPVKSSGTKPVAQAKPAQPATAKPETPAAKPTDKSTPTQIK